MPQLDCTVRRIGDYESRTEEYELVFSVGRAARRGLEVKYQAARAYDLAGKRNDALAQYRIVLTRPDSSNAHDQARQGLKEPYKLKNNGKNVSE